MSSAERAGAAGRRRASRAGAALALLALLAGTSACAGAADAVAAGAATGTVAPGIPADDTTRRIAQVEFERQCTVDAMSFVQEADITTDLDTRLAAAGFTHGLATPGLPGGVPGVAATRLTCRLAAPGLARRLASGWLRPGEQRQL